MGTETKFNCYTKNSTSTTSDDTCISKGLSAVVCNTSSNQIGNANRVQNKSKGAVNGAKKSSQTPNNAVTAVPIRIDENNVVEGAKELLKIIRSDWDLNKVQFKAFTDGITNKLLGCFYNETDESVPNKAEVIHNKSKSGHANNGTARTTNGVTCTREDNDDSGHLSDTDSESESNSSSTDSSNRSGSSKNVVLVRVYGNKTDLLIDRAAEKRNILLLHSYGFAPPLFATFKNGLAYDYVPGVTLNANNVLEPKVWRLVACRMAEMHRLVNARDTDGGSTSTSTSTGAGNGEPIVPMLLKKTLSFLDLVPERFSDPAKHKRLEGTFLPITKMRDEFAQLYSRLEALNSPLVFAHNDLLLGNVVYNESLGTVTFIDYEYADFNFQAFDIGNHFAEFAGVDEVDYSRYPGREFQYEWLRVYLQEYLQRSQISDAEIHRLYVQVNQFALAAHFFWIIWSLIQAEHSNIDFDYVDYAFLRYQEYLAKKDAFLALDMNGTS